MNLYRHIVEFKGGRMRMVEKYLWGLWLLFLAAVFCFGCASVQKIAAPAVLAGLQAEASMVDALATIDPVVQGELHSREEVEAWRVKRTTIRDALASFDKALRSLSTVLHLEGGGK